MKFRSKSYWIKTDQNKIIISSIKNKYLKSLKKEEKKLQEILREKLAYVGNQHITDLEN